MTLINPKGRIGLVVPSGISADKSTSTFFRSVSTTGRLKALYDFENRRKRFDLPPFFPDVDTRFKFSVFVAGRKEGEFAAARCACFVQDLSELGDQERCFELTAKDFAKVNPNTGTAPIFRTRKDAELTTAIYDRVPVLVDRSGGEPVKSWPVRYHRMFDITNDSGLFRARAELEEKEGAWPIGGHSFDSPSGRWVPLYEGKMVQAYDHRAASVITNPENLFRPGQPLAATLDQHKDPAWMPAPQYWVPEDKCSAIVKNAWVLGFKHVTAPTNARTMIASLIPFSGVGNSFPLILVESSKGRAAETASLFLAVLNSIVLDFVLRQKVQGQNLNWYIVEQLPIIPQEQFTTTRFGKKSAAEIIREAVLELTYTAHSIGPFAQDLGYVRETGEAKSYFMWDDERRLALRAKMDAVFFLLYGITDREDVRYIYSTFPIVEAEENEKYGSYRSLDLCLSWMNALAAGKPDADIEGDST